MALRRWLRRNLGVIIIVVAVVGTVFGTRQLELAIGDRHERWMTAQVVVAQLQSSLTPVYRQALDALQTPNSPVGFQRSKSLRSDYLAAAARLRRTWPGATSGLIAAQAATLSSDVSQTLALAQTGQLERARENYGTIVTPAYARASGEASRAQQQLARHARASDSLEEQSSLAAALAAIALLLTVIIWAAYARGRRDLAETERRASHDAGLRLRALVHNSSDVIVVVEPNSRVTYEAGAVRAVLGAEPGDLDGRRLTEWADPDEIPLLLSLCGTRSHEHAEVRLRRSDEAWRTCEIHATSLLGESRWEGVVLHIWDITDRKTLELELRLAQKLEAVGELAAGIAHEINTPIQYVGDTSRFIDNAFTELIPVLDLYAELLAACQDGTVTPELLDKVEEAHETADVDYLRERIPAACERTIDGVYRVSKIVRALRAFAHPPSLEIGTVDVNEAIRNTLIVATNEYKYVADVSTELSELPAINGNAGDINQVLLNLVVNAAQAIGEVVGESGDRGSIDIRTWRHGHDVWISIADTGPGITDEVAGRVFDPFFTTKEVGRGTGQGLAISRTIVVERHGGSLTFESEPGKGTTFLIRLPARVAMQAPERAAA